MEKSLDQEITQLEKRVIKRLLRQSIEPNLESAELEHHRPYVTYRRKLEFFRSCLSNLLSLSTLIYVLIGFNVAYLYLFSLELLGSLLSTTNINELYGAWGGVLFTNPYCINCISLAICKNNPAVKSSNYVDSHDSNCYCAVRFFHSDDLTAPVI